MSEDFEEDFAEFEEEVEEFEEEEVDEEDTDYEIRTIYPTNIKKYSGFVYFVKSSCKWRVEIRSLKYYNPGFKTQQQAEAHLIDKNFEWSLHIKNVIYDFGKYCQMMLTKDKMTIFDNDDLEIAQKHTWSYQNGYAVTRIGRKYLRFHNAIMDFTPHNGLSIDHTNIDPLDNTRENLRIATNREQCVNQRIQSNNKTGIKGVSYDDKDKRWRAKWADFEGKQCSKTFSVAKYGDNAKKLAADYRRKMENKYYSY